VFTRLPEEVRNFVMACMHRNPDKRASCEELLNSEWMLNLQEELIQDIVKGDHGVSEIHKIAKNSLKALINFN
jgi:serine/threonine protein kinase